MTSKPKFTMVTALELSSITEPSHTMQTVELEHAKPSQLRVLEMSDAELDQLTDAKGVQGLQTRTASRQQRHSKSNDGEDHSPRYGRIEQQFLPARMMEVTPLLGGQRAHKIVVRNGRLVDVTEEEEDKLAITALKKAEENARSKGSISASSSPLRSPRGSGASTGGEGIVLSGSPSSATSSFSSLTSSTSSSSSVSSASTSSASPPGSTPAISIERVLLPRSSAGFSLASPRSPRVDTTLSRASPRTKPGSRKVDVVVPIAVSIKEIRAAVAEAMSEVKTIEFAPAESVVQRVEPTSSVATTVHVSEAKVLEPVVFHVPHAVHTSMVVESEEVVSVPTVVVVPSPSTATVVATTATTVSPSNPTASVATIVNTATVAHTATTAGTETGGASPSTLSPSLSRVSAETVDGARHPILSVDFTDREMSDADLVPELSKLPDDRSIVLLLNGNDMLREGAEELNRLLLGGKMIQSLQLQWNLLGSEGAAALVAGICKTKFLKFVDLTGNELEEEGAIALSAALKENQSIQSLVIPENQIGNEGISVIAHALKHNTTLQTLDVTQNNIFEEGAQFLAGVLEHHNTTLVELRMGGNGIRSEGGCALARAVTVHPKLNHLELQNCLIDDEGIIDLCRAVVANPKQQFEYLDVALNNFSIRGELYMQDLLMNETVRCEVHWKDLDASRLFEIDEIDAIVDHFGVARIIDKYLKEETLLPLIPFDVLLPNISFNDPELSDDLVANVLDKLNVSRTLFIRGMDLLNILLYHLTASDAIITTIADNHVINSIFDRLGDFVAILKSSQHNNTGPAGSGAGNKPRLGFVRFKTLELLVNLMKFNNPHLHEQLVHHRVISNLLDLMFEWPNNNFVHHQIKDLVVIILYSQSEVLLTDLLIGAHLPKRIMQSYVPQMALDVGFHKGFFGHLTEMANYIATSLPTFHFMGSYNDWKTWNDFVEGPLEEMNVLLETGYEGMEIQQGGPAGSDEM